ncbi:MAG: 7-cyano-7-deazaguanine synthase QueC [Nitrospinae bacterium]|nr:7-cyano-7-deazaguanine synthase QueC [Nitrospinota bacterium]
MKKAVVLVSGGMDSATVLAVAADLGFETHTLSFDYGQRHRVELKNAEDVSHSLGAVDHKVVKVDLVAIGGSALTSGVPVPKSAPGTPVLPGMPVTYVPARNTIFLSIALGYGETLGTGDIFIGVNALDYSGYPDCRPEYIESFERMANLALKSTVTGATKVKIHTPLIAMTKGEIVETGMRLGVNFALTISCYDPSPDGVACGMCDSCRLRAKGFAEAGIEDPAMGRG